MNETYELQELFKRIFHVTATGNIQAHYNKLILAFPNEKSTLFYISNRDNLFIFVKAERFA